MQLPEVIIWSQIKNKKIHGVKFRRQYSIDFFIVDFYAPEIKLAIEIDGDSHFLEQEDIEYDSRRQNHIEGFGVIFLRFMNYEVFTNLDGVVENIFNVVYDLKFTSPSPSLSEGGEYRPPLTPP